MDAIQTSRLILTTWEPDDWKFAHALASDAEVVRYIGDGQPWSEDGAREFVTNQIAYFVAWGFCFWKLLLLPDKQAIGFCGIQPLLGTTDFEIGWWLTPAHWGKGLATEAARACLDDAFTRAGLRRVVALGMAENTRSLRVMKKLGMMFERNTTHKGLPVVLYATHNSAVL